MAFVVVSALCGKIKTVGGAFLIVGDHHIHPEYFLILPKKNEEDDGEGSKKGKKKQVQPKKPTKRKFDEWIYVLKNSSVKSHFTAAGIQAAREKLDVLKMTPEQRAEYKADQANQRMKMDQKSQLYTAELKGRIEGKAETLQEAVIRGYRKGHSIDSISEFTELSSEQIISILKENGLM